MGKFPEILIFHETTWRFSWENHRNIWDLNSCQAWINKPQTAGKLGGYHLSIGWHDYWRSTPLINKLWFINPGLTLMIIHDVITKGFIKHGQLENPPFSSMIVPSKPRNVQEISNDDDVWCVMPRWDKQKPEIFTDWYNGITYIGHVYR